MLNIYMGQLIYECINPEATNTFITDKVSDESHKIY